MAPEYRSNMQLSTVGMKNNACLRVRSIRRVSKGFTLVELLVVIAIILMLVALLMPSLAHIRETAKNTKCVSNLRQITQVTLLYAADNDGFAPYSDIVVANVVKDETDPYFTPRSRTTGDPTYHKDYPQNKWLAEYFDKGALGKMNSVGYCPKGGRLGEVGANPVNGGKSYGNMSYGLNPDLFEDWDFANEHSDKDRVPLTMVSNPATRAFWLDGTKSKLWPKEANMSGRHFSKSKEVSNGIGPVIGPYTVYQYHGRCNVSFLDNHISSLRVPDELPHYSCRFWRLDSNAGIAKCPAKRGGALCDKAVQY
jgi:prepilin-type N-terminal cleavage/methylation domain-containing protein